MQSREIRQLQETVTRQNAHERYRNSSTDTGQTITCNEYTEVIEVWLTDGTNTATATITLPPVSIMKGRKISVIVHDAAGGVTLQDGDDSVDWQGDYTLDANNDAIYLESDGQQWHELENKIS